MGDSSAQKVPFRAQSSKQLSGLWCNNSTQACKRSVWRAAELCHVTVGCGLTHRKWVGPVWCHRCARVSLCLQIFWDQGSLDMTGWATIKLWLAPWKLLPAKVMFDEWITRWMSNWDRGREWALKLACGSYKTFEVMKKDYFLIGCYS